MQDKTVKYYGGAVGDSIYTGDPKFTCRPALNFMSSSKHDTKGVVSHFYDREDS